MTEIESARREYEHAWRLFLTAPPAEADARFTAYLAAGRRLTAALPSSNMPHLALVS